MFTLAHLTDVHLGPLPPGAAWHNFALKRPIGCLSWSLRRHKLHDPAIAALIAADIRNTAPGHVALTGDIVNIAAYAEFAPAARWMQALGSPQSLTFVPGNHDCYVNVPWQHGLAHFAPWMAGDMRVKQTQTDARIATPFPFVRLRKNIALIGLSSAQPQPLHRAAGALGPLQLQSLARLLRDLRERGFARIVLIHHPPLPGLAAARKALKDSAALRDILVQEGAELVLHGHNHQHMMNPLKTRFGTCHVMGAPSASMAAAEHYPPAAWYLYRIHRQDGGWRANVTVRSFEPQSRAIVTSAEFSLST